jgi:quinoprotein glucose dehydrogenase
MQLDRRGYLALVGAAASGALAGCAGGPRAGGDPSGVGSGDGGEGSSGYEVETVATGLDRPWGMVHLPDERALLLTERVGRLWLVDRDGGERRQVENSPEVFARGQGGLLDVALHPSFPGEPWVYLTYSHRRDDGASTTRLARGRLERSGSEANPRLVDRELLYTAEPYVESTGHFGSRLAFGPEGLLYATVGDRQFKNFGPDHVAQDRSNDLGTTLRLAPDGTVPASNPFVDDPEARDAVFSWGHRNAQGLTTHPETGEIWEAEFGERDGDELNVLEAGANYGWPVADEGCRYGTDDPIGVSHDEREDVVGPVYSWPCGSGGFPPSGAVFYDEEAFPEWQGNLFVGGLASRYLARFRVEGREVTEAGSLLADRGWRIRDVALAPDTGHLYVAVDAGDAPLVRLVPG